MLPSAPPSVHTDSGGEDEYWKDGGMEKADASGDVSGRCVEPTLNTRFHQALAEQGQTNSQSARSLPPQPPVESSAIGFMANDNPILREAEREHVSSINVRGEAAAWLEGSGSDTDSGSGSDEDIALTLGAAGSGNDGRSLFFV